MTPLHPAAGLPPLLALVPPERGQQRAALMVTAIAGVLFLAVAPFAKVPLPALGAFLPIYQSVYVVISLITAVLLLGQVRILRLRSLLILAGAFLFDAFMAVAHALSFPGLFTPTGLLGAGEQTTAWLYFLWHGGFPLLVAGYGLLKGRTEDVLPRAMRIDAANIACIGASFALAAGLTLLTTSGHDLLPPLMRGDLDAPNKIVAATPIWLLSIAALVVLWQRRPHALLDLWLMVVVSIWIFDSALAAVLNHGRYDVGWYAGRVCGLVAGSLVLVMLLLENNWLYLQLANLRAQERRESSERLQESEARFERLFRNAPLALGLVGHDGRILAQNDRFEKLFGYTLADIATVSQWWQFAYPDPVYRAEVTGRWEAAVHAAGGAGGRIDAGECRIACKDGSQRHVEITGIVVEEGLLTGFVDVTARHQAELALRESQAAELMRRDEARLAALNQMEDANAARRRAEAVEAELRQFNAGLERRVAERTAELTAANQELDAFAYAVSHDLRAPLRAMSGFSTALVEDFGDKVEGEAKVYLEQIVIASRKMGELIEGILALSRSTRGDLRRAPVDLSAMATRLLADLARGEPARTVDCRVAPGLAVTGDAPMVEAVMTNLLGNAWKYTAQRADALIRVYAGEVAGRSGICVADNGAGFDMAHAARLFKPFQRLHRQDEFPGIGIGLATVQRIIHRHGGEIVAEGHPGEGATFCFSLPPAEQGGSP